MPYLLTERKKALDSGERKNLSVGDANYLVTQFFIREWFKKDCQAYKTIHRFRKLVTHPIFDGEFMQLINEIKLTSNLDDADLLATRELAFHEFMRRIGDVYEDTKIKQNGDVYPSDEAPKQVAGFKSEGDR